MALAGTLAACGPRFHEKDAFRRASEGRRTFRRTAARAPPLDPATFEKVDETSGSGCSVGRGATRSIDNHSGECKHTRHLCYLHTASHGAASKAADAAFFETVSHQYKRRFTLWNLQYLFSCPAFR